MRPAGKSFTLGCTGPHSWSPGTRLYHSFCQSHSGMRVNGFTLQHDMTPIPHKCSAFLIEGK